MRFLQLKTCLQHPFTPEQQAEYAQGEMLLQKLSATRPLGIDATQEQEYLRLLTSICRQYRGQGLGWLELLRISYAALANYLAERGRASDKTANYIAFSIREEIILSLFEKQEPF